MEKKLIPDSSAYLLIHQKRKKKGLILMELTDCGGCVCYFLRPPKPPGDTLCGKEQSAIKEKTFVP